MCSSFAASLLLIDSLMSESWVIILGVWSICVFDDSPYFWTTTVTFFHVTALGLVLIPGSFRTLRN